MISPQCPWEDVMDGNGVHAAGTNGVHVGYIATTPLWSSMQPQPQVALDHGVEQAPEHRNLWSIMWNMQEVRRSAMSEYRHRR